ncbi:putative ubiquinone biosynthesis monooxygenase [Microsporum ferrugineum]
MRSVLGGALRPYICTSCKLGLQLQRKRFASSLSRQPDIYDIVCVGGGPAGLALLAALRSSPITSKLKVALVESQDITKAKSWNLDSDHFSNRVSSLTPSSVAFLKGIGAWQHVDTSRVQPYEEMEVWDGVTGSNISFNWPPGLIEHDASSKTVATMTENANLIRGLLSRIDSLGDDVSVFSSTKVSSINNGTNIIDGPDLSSWPVLTLSPSSSAEANTELPTIAARLLVGADGINSPVRSFAGISTDGWDYDRHGVVATLKLSPSTQSSTRPVTAYQRFLPGIGGPVAMLPLPNNYATLVWSTTVQNAAYLKSLSPEAFTTMVNAAFRLSITDLKYMFSLPPSPTEASENLYDHGDELSWRLEHTSVPSFVPPEVETVHSNTVAAFPLRFRHASTYISPRVALVGDAAHVIHPLGGLGLNLGVGDVISLQRTIEYAIQHGMDIGALLSLEQYAADRWITNAGIGGACDLLHKAYNVPGYGPFAWARGVGLDAVNSLSTLKELIMKRASTA